MLTKGRLNHARREGCRAPGQSFFRRLGSCREVWGLCPFPDAGSKALNGHPSCEKMGKKRTGRVWVRSYLQVKKNKEPQGPECQPGGGKYWTNGPEERTERRKFYLLLGWGGVGGEDPKRDKSNKFNKVKKKTRSGRSCQLSRVKRSRRCDQK